jgi:hypothetical protein
MNLVLFKQYTVTPVDRPHVRSQFRVRQSATSNSKFAAAAAVAVRQTSAANHVLPFTAATPSLVAAAVAAAVYRF